MSGQGLESYRAEYLAKQGGNLKGGLEFANNILTGYKFNPIYSKVDPSQVVGTHLVFASESDFGGSVPKVLMQKVAPKALHELVEEVAKLARRFP